MADDVTSAILANGRRNLIKRFTNLSPAGVGEAAVLKLDATDTALGNDGIANGVYWAVKGIKYSIANGTLRILWDADTDADLFVLEGEGEMAFDRGAIKVPAVADLAGRTGSIRFTTVGWMINASYDVTIHMIKGVPQS